MRYAFLLLFLSAAGSAQYRAARTGGNYMHNYYLPAAASTPWRPAFSPDGRSLVFAMSGSIWQMRVDDDTAYELTASSTYDSDPVFSPDGRWIAYTADDHGRSINLMLLNVATGESSPLTRGTQVNLDPAFSPDGRQLAYVSTEPGGWFHIYTLPIDNGKPGTPQRLTNDHRYGRARLYFSDQDHHIQPTWSPDGKELILISNRGIPLGSGGIWRVKAEPDAMRNARLLLREETLFRTRPQWSPEGKRILYSSHRGAQFTNLYVLPVEGGEPYQLTFGNWDHFEPRWSPDGEWIVYVSNEHGLSDLRLLRTFGGEERRLPIRRQVYRRPMGTVEIRVDRPARVYARAADGKTYAPPDAYQRVGRRNEPFFHTSGRSVFEAPAGPLSVEVVHGFEHYPAAKSVTVQPDSVTLVEFALTRMTNLKAQGWYSGSNHVHMNYGGNLLNTPENLLFMAAAEDMDVIGEKICNKDHRIFDHQYFTGKLDPRSTPDRLLYFDEEYRPPFYGHVSFIGLTKHLISPFTTGYEGSAIESLYPSNTDMFRLARAQGALTGYVHPWTSPPEKGSYGVARGFPVDLALGVTDYLELMSSAQHGVHTTDVWHRAMNCGFRISATAGEDSILSLHQTPIIGANRTYAYLGPKLDWNAWMDAVRRGRTFITNGPLVELRINNRLPGDEIRLPPGGGSVQVQARLLSVAPVERFEIIQNNQVVASSSPAEGRIEKTVAITRSSWFTVRAVGGTPQRPIDDSIPIAETGAIYVLAGDQPIRSRTDAEYFLRWIDDLTRQANEHPGWRSERERRHVLGQFAEARKVFAQRAAEAK
jgi:Tol biopolymer transport system component